MNPMMGEVTAGTAQTVQSAPLANQQMAHVENEDALANAIPNAANSAFNAIMQGATAKKDSKLQIFWMKLRQLYIPVPKLILITSWMR